MTRKLDLRTGNPVWTSYRAPRIPAAPLTRDAKADVLVVGMGISGAMIAEELTAAGMDVIAIDRRRRPLLGSTAATTALVQYEIDQPLTKLTRSIGRDRAERAWRRSRIAVANLAARIDRVGINCAMSHRPSLLLAGNVLGAGDLRDEAEARRAAGLYADYLTHGQLKDQFGIDRDGAILSPDNLALDPRKLAAGLFLAARARGARFHAPAEAVGFETSAAEVLTRTAKGPVIRSSHVVLATGYELADIAPAGGHSIISTWAIATKPQKARLWPREA